MRQQGSAFAGASGYVIVVDGDENKKRLQASRRISDEICSLLQNP